MLVDNRSGDLFGGYATLRKAKPRVSRPSPAQAEDDLCRADDPLTINLVSWHRGSPIPHITAKALA